MNRDDITRMAQEAGFKPHNNPEMWDITIASDEAIERFFHLAYAAGAAAERNAILQMSNEQWFKTQADFEAAIRARSKQ